MKDREKVFNTTNVPEHEAVVEGASSTEHSRALDAQPLQSIFSRR
jgi:hypothetical protein